MGALTYAAALALAAKCGGGLPSVWLAGIALHESGLMPQAVSPTNRNNTHDWGIGQINDATLAQVGLTRETALDECQNMAGMARYLRILSSYHTGPSGAFDPVYVSSVLKDMHKFGNGLPEPPVRSRHHDVVAEQNIDPSTNRFISFTLPERRR